MLFLSCHLREVIEVLDKEPRPLGIESLGEHLSERIILEKMARSTSARGEQRAGLSQQSIFLAFHQGLQDVA